MKNSLRCVFAVALAAQAGLLVSAASAQATWTASVAPAPTYANTLNFDEAPLPAGVPGVVASNAYVGRGVSAINWIGGTGVLVNSGNSVFGTTFMPANNQALSNAYIEFYFSQDITAFSAQFWDSAPNAGFMGGGARIDMSNNGVVVSSFFINNPFWTSNISAAGTLPTWFNVVANPGVVFDQVTFNGFGTAGFGSDDLAVDNMSWTTVPTPGAAALLGIGGLVGLRRRR